MNDPFDPLEAELAALKPREASPDLDQRIANELGDCPSPGRLWVAQRTTARRTTALAIAAALAACAIAALVLRPGPRPTIAEPAAEIPHPPIAAAFDDAMPSVWTYRRALSRSPSDLEALLDKHATLAPGPADSPRANLFIRSDRTSFFEGEL